MRIDSHQHFWRYDPVEYGWMDERMDVLKADHLPDELAPHLEEHKFDGCIAVQARQALAENDLLLGLARESDLVRGVVGWVELCSPDVEEQLDALAGEEQLVGIRHVVQDEPDDEFLLREDFQRGIAALAGRGLVYDVLIYPKQLPAALRFVERFPDQPMVLDHIAKPLVAEQRLEPWSYAVRELAENEHLSCKVSGLITEADWEHWQPEDFLPYFEVVREAFGEERLLYGSDWPMCRVAGEYDRVVELAEVFASELSAAGRAAFFGGNAARVYGLS